MSTLESTKTRMLSLDSLDAILLLDDPAALLTARLDQLVQREPLLPQGCADSVQRAAGQHFLGGDEEALRCFRDGDKVTLLDPQALS